MKSYEGMFILKPQLDKDTLQKTITFIGDSITKNGGQLEKIQEWGKRRLTHRIKRNQEGVYFLVDFKIAPTTITELSHSYKLNESILRDMIIVKG